MKTYKYFLLYLYLTACNSIESINQCTVCDIVSNPRKFSVYDQVTVKGRVTDVAGLLGYNGFILKDFEEECTIIVLTERITPIIGEEITVSGKLKELISFGDNRVLAIEESSE